MRNKMVFTIFEGDSSNRDTRTFYWRLSHHNGKIVADGAEAYSKRANAKRAVKALIAGFGINVSGQGWRARLAQRHGIIVRTEE